MTPQEVTTMHTQDTADRTNTAITAGSFRDAEGRLRQATRNGAEELERTLSEY
jgi:hypothetical protein